MEIYQFVKYNTGVLPEYSSGFQNNNITICYDLEDSIQDILEPQNTPGLKKYYRSLLETIIYRNYGRLKNTSIGLRLNPVDTNELLLDIETISKISTKIKIKSLLLPKTEVADDLVELSGLLYASKIMYREIIPIIETKKGMENLPSIIDFPAGTLKKIAFGHCDFNLDNDHFPFYHQDSDKYWSWIEQIMSAIKTRGLLFLNSPYQKLNDDKGFLRMLYKLDSVCKSRYGQFTLTYRQSELCMNYSGDRIIGQQSDTGYNKTDPVKYAKEIISNYEKHYLNKGFVLTGEGRIILSPHEYLAAKKFLKVYGC